MTNDDPKCQECGARRSTMCECGYLVHEPNAGPTPDHHHFRSEASAEVSRLQKENERLRQMIAPIRSVVVYGRDLHNGEFVGGVSMGTWRSLLAELEHTDG